jgi:hypothetical protein
VVYIVSFAQWHIIKEVARLTDPTHIYLGEGEIKNCVNAEDNQKDITQREKMVTIVIIQLQ